jgi:predicted permease
MEPFSRLLFFFVDLILPMTFGYFLRKNNRLGELGVDRMIKAGIVGVDPVLNFLSFWIIALDPQLIWLPVLGIVINIIPGLIAFFQSKRKYQNSLKKGSYILATMLSNRGVVGMLTVYALYGEQGYALVAILLVSGPIFVYTFCYPLAQHYFQANNHLPIRRASLTSIFFNWKQIPMIGLAAGILVNILNLPRPAEAGAIFPYFIHGSAWLFMIPVGYALDFRALWENWRETLDLLWIKFLLTPLLSFIFLRWLPLDKLALDVVLILSFAPTAINAVVIARIFRLDINVAMTGFVLTTIAYMVFVLPFIWLLFG